MIRILCLIVGGWSLIGAAPAAIAKAPSVLYLTWMHDPTTTMTVQWHTTTEDPVTQVYYRKVGEAEWRMQEGIYQQLPKTNLLVHTVELDELVPNGEYQFRLGGRKGEYRFRTLPDDLSRPVKFVIGGDAYFYLATMRKMNAQIASCDPDFVVVGGDIAYTNGRRAVFKGKGWELKRWRTFLKEWKSQMVTSDGRLIPIMPVLGNHDIKATTLKPMSHHFYFYDLFAMEEKGMPYRVLDAGNYLSLFLLDTGHSYNIGGQQTDWLKKTLSSRENVAYKMAAYHIAGYPSVYPFKGSGPKRIRAEWSPLFERYHLNVAFEHHNHAYKRTHPMKASKIDPDGVIYMGDGSWGVTPRKPKHLWYLDAAAQVNAVCLVTLKPDASQVEALTISGQVIDSVMTLPTQSMVAWNEGQLLESY
ncbi:MAG: metallophosphoesterase family protein [Verrucomicrobia bacterium]|nr:metallophosphoesterase family protein [Verrucomicrobiota bacterium]